MAIGLAMAVIAGALAGCDDPAPKTSAEYIELANQHLAAGKTRAGVIELKNALQIEPKNAEARFLLGTSYLALFDTRGAEKELRRARDLGIKGHRMVVSEARLYMMQGDTTRLIEEILPNPNWPLEVLGEVHALRGQAHLRANNAVDAKT